MKSSAVGTLDKKWERLLRYAHHFRHVPFVDFVLAAGSMAMGTARDDSDFDVIVGVSFGRIFTVRMITALLFGLLGARRWKADHKENAKDKLCFNHFVTPAGYTLDPPRNEYWACLYRRLVPIYGADEAIEKFFSANEWCGRRQTALQCAVPAPRHESAPSAVRCVLERILGGGLGDAVEDLCRRYQVRRIEKNIGDSLGYKPYVKYDDDEIRFHIDTRRIEEWVNSL